MTQYQHADRRTTVLMPALVAAAVSATITVAGVLFIGQPTVPALGPGATVGGQHNAGIQSGRIWQAQQEQQSVSALRLQRIRAYQQSETMRQAGVDWQLRYEQTTPKNRNR